MAVEYLVFPAPAGVIRFRTHGEFSAFCFPRTCGGDPDSIYAEEIIRKFSPHLRG